MCATCTMSWAAALDFRARGDLRPGFNWRLFSGATMAGRRRFPSCGPSGGLPHCMACLSLGFVIFQHPCSAPIHNSLEASFLQRVSSAGSRLIDPAGSPGGLSRLCRH